MVCALNEKPSFSECDLANVMQHLRHTWDASGNLLTRQDIHAQESAESFTYDFLDRLTGVTGLYSQSYAYDSIGNLTSMAGTSLLYEGESPHAVTSAGNTDYSYDLNGNMTDRGADSLVWDAENRLTEMGEDSFVYDGNGRRVSRYVGGVYTRYYSKYYEETDGTALRSYYLGERLIAQLEGNETLCYVHQDHLTGTSVMSDADGNLLSSESYYPYGTTRTGDVDTDRKFTGQVLDDTGLYYYGARYYDPGIGRFISPDPFVESDTASGTVSSPMVVSAIPVGPGSVGSPTAWYPETEFEAPLNPQALNRYTYVLNNPLKYVDPEGLWTLQIGINLSAALGAGVGISFGIVVSPSGLQGYVTPQGVASAFPGASATGQIIWTSAPDAYALTGTPSTTITGGYGGGATIAPDVVIGSGYGGGGIDIGVSAGPLPIIAEASVGQTYVTDPVQIQPIWPIGWPVP